MHSFRTKKKTVVKQREQKLTRKIIHFCEFAVFSLCMFILSVAEIIRNYHLQQSIRMCLSRCEIKINIYYMYASTEKLRSYLFYLSRKEILHQVNIQFALHFT